MKLYKVIILVGATIILKGAETNLKAQSIIPTDGMITHNDAPRPCIVVDIEPDPSTLKHAWADYLKENHGLKLKGLGFLSNKDLLSAEEVVITQISPKTINFYTSIFGTQSGSEMKVFASYEYDVYLDRESSPNEFNGLMNIVEHFIKIYLPVYHQDKIEALEHQIGSLLKEQNELQENIANSSNKIDELSSEIIKMQKELEANETEFKLAQKKLKDRKAKLVRIKGQIVQM
jgi:hypothetical protein